MSKEKRFGSGEWDGRNNVAIAHERKNRPGMRRATGETTKRFNVASAATDENEKNNLVIREPAGQQTIESHVVVPFMWALIIAAAVGAGMLYAHWRWVVDWAWVFFVPLCTFLLAFVMRTGVGDKLLWHLEEWFGDINGDGVEGEPTKPYTEVIINNVKKPDRGYAPHGEAAAFVAGESVNRIKIPMTQEELKLVGYRLAMGWPYSRDTFTKDSSISQPRYDNEILPVLREQGLIIEARGKANEPTEKAKIMWSHFAPPTYPPRPNKPVGYASYPTGN